MHWRLYVAKDAENHQIFTDLYVGIAMNIKKSTTIMGPICEYYNECKKNNQQSLCDLYVGITYLKMTLCNFK